MPVEPGITGNFLDCQHKEPKKAKTAQQNQTLAANSRSRLTGNFCESTGEKIGGTGNSSQRIDASPRAARPRYIALELWRFSEVEPTVINPAGFYNALG